MSLGLGQFLLGMTAPLIVRGVIALGFTAVTFSGVTLAVDSLVLTAQNSWSAIPSTVLQLASLSGIPEFLGLVFGAIVARMAIWASVGAAKYVFKG